MSYEPTNWKSGDTITSAKLNKLENGLAEASGGGGGGVLIVGATYTETSVTLDKTWKEIKDALFAVLIRVSEDGGIWGKDACPIFMMDDDNGYNVFISFPYVAEGDLLAFNVLMLTTDSENGYPSITMG